MSLASEKATVPSWQPRKTPAFGEARCTQGVAVAPDSVLFLRLHAQEPFWHSLIFTTPVHSFGSHPQVLLGPGSHPHLPVMLVTVRRAQPRMLTHCWKRWGPLGTGWAHPRSITAIRSSEKSSWGGLAQGQR